MVSPTKERPFPAPPSQANYSAVPNPNSSPDPANTYASLGSPQLPDSAFHSPETVDTSQLLGRSGSEYLPAPSMTSRDSIASSLLPPGATVPGSRGSWVSNTGLTGAAEGVPVADGTGRHLAPRGQSNLAHSTLGWNNADDERLSTDDSDEQGHITPAAAAGAGVGEKTPRWAEEGSKPKRSRKGLWIVAGVAALALVALAVGLGVGLTRKSNSTTRTAGNAKDNINGVATSGSIGASSGQASATASAAAPLATSGGLGSLITMTNGATMNYTNSLGGTWVWDPANPLNNEAQCNSWTPALNQNWTWGKDKVYGVNLGGWLNTEPFIVPALYEKYATGPNNQTAVDEYTLSQNMGTNLSAALTEHYSTFITEQDIAEIASAGLNWVRIPLPHWAIETWPGEPYLERVAWTYFLQAIQWCRKYGIRINLDFHTVPGSQNGWNHSGHLGSINWMYGVMGTANAQRALDYIRTLAQFISQDEYSPVIQMFGFINEPDAPIIGQAAVGSFYYEAYRIIRDITGIGEGNGPFLSIHDGFIGSTTWYGFLPGADRLALDQHSYIVFGNQVTGDMDAISKLPCQYWGASTNKTSQQWGMNMAGEWSAAWNDCGLWVNNVGAGSRYDGSYYGYTGPKPGSCALWNDYTLWNASVKADMLTFVQGSMDALQNYFFWTWKIGNSTGAIEQVNPFWNYQLGLEQGWIPSDPRSAIGTCAQQGVDNNEFNLPYASAWMTGGAGADQIPASMSSSYPWPVSSFTNVGADSMSQLPQYTQTGTVITMPGATFTSPGSNATIPAGNGWFNANADSRQAYAAVSGCSYPSEYSAASIGVPTSACGAGIAQPTKRAFSPGPTQPPRL